MTINKNKTTMYKKLFRIAFLFATGICMTACSSGDDDIADNTTPTTPNTKENVVTLTGTISADSETTRALGTDGKSISWTDGDVIAVHYQKTDNFWATVQGTISNITNNGHDAKFTAKLIDPKNLSNIGLAYPYVHVLNSTHTTSGAAALDFDYNCLNNQGGTTVSITNAKQDLAKTTDTDIAITISGATATLSKNALLKNQVCICKFNLKMGNKADGASSYANYYASSITVTDKSYSPNVAYTVESKDIVSGNALKTNTFYVAMRKTYTTTANISINTTTGSGLTLSGTLDPDNLNSSTDVGKIIGVDHDDSNTAKLYTLNPTANVTINYSNVNLANGKFYNKDVLIGENITPVAVIAHVGNVPNYWSKFLAIGIDDVETGTTVQQNSSTAQTATVAWVGNHNVTVSGTPYTTIYQGKYDDVAANTAANSDTGWDASASTSTAYTSAQGKWRVPSVTDWRYVIQGLGDGTSATSPKGVMDYEGIYPGESSAGLHSGPTSKNNINSHCGNETLHGVVYWTSSGLKNSSETKAWRCDFAYGYYMWNSTTDEARIRLVLAY